MSTELYKNDCITGDRIATDRFHMILTNPKIDSYDLTGWKIIIGGSALPTARWRSGAPAPASIPHRRDGCRAIR